MENKHSKKTLKYFIGLDVLYEHSPIQKSIAILSGVTTENEKGALLRVPATDHCAYVDADRVTPILKTVDQLSEEDISHIYDCEKEDVEKETDDIFSDDEAGFSKFRIWHRSSIEYVEYDCDNIFNDFHFNGSWEGLSPKVGHKILQRQAGAIPCKESHTGYKDFIFGLPCYKFGEVG